MVSHALPYYYFKRHKIIAATISGPRAKHARALVAARSPSRTSAHTRVCVCKVCFKLFVYYLNDILLYTYYILLHHAINYIGILEIQKRIGLDLSMTSDVSREKLRGRRSINQIWRTTHVAYLHKYHTYVNF